MRICILGSSGLIGKPLVEKLRGDGHEVIKLVRNITPSARDEIAWNPLTGEIARPSSLEGFDAVINLAGENIASRRWTANQKKQIEESRVKGTLHLAQHLASLKNPPKILLNASAIGFYGNRGEEEVDEDSSPGDDFLASVCQKWEGAAKSAEERGVRVVKLRIGAVLAREGGALQKMLTPFKLGLGGVIGSGKQYFSWIAIDDVLDIIVFVLKSSQISGAVNAVSPHPVTNRTFTEYLGRVLHRPTVLPLPAFAARLMFGEMADAIMLGGAKVFPKKLLVCGYKFKYPDLQSALIRYVC